MKPTEKIDFNNVEALTRQLTARKIILPRFSLDIPECDAANGIYSAMKAEVARFHGELVLDADTRSHIADVARWLVDPAGKPGIILMGTCGNGKTTMLRAISALIEYVTELTLGRTRRKVVEFRTAKEIEHLCSSEEKADNKTYRDLFATEMLAIDDLGQEACEVMRFGRIHTPIIDLITDRYNRQLPTLVTSNLTAPQLSEKYGTRIADRFNEMLERISYTNPSYRR